MDKLFGIPAVMAYALAKKIFRIGSSELVTQTRENSICLLKTAAIGDTVLLLSVVKALRQSTRFKIIKIYCGPSNYAFAKLIPDVDEVILLPVTNPLKSFPLLRRHHFDIVIDFGSWPRLDALYANIIPSACCIGFSCSGQYRHYAYDKTVEHSKKSHELQNYKNLLKLINIKELPLPCLPWALELSEQIKKKYNICNNKYVVAHLWPGGAQKNSKMWATDRWLQLFRLIYSTYKTPILLTGSSEDVEKNEAICKAVYSENIYVLNGARSTLSESVALLAHARLVISVDTGILHIASALHTPLIGLHGPTHSDRWGARSNLSISINACQSISDAPISLGFENARESLMDKIKVHDVFQAAQAFLRSDTQGRTELFSD